MNTPPTQPLRTIGMLGGMSWESSLEYYRIANELVRERLGSTHSARIVLDSLDFADIETLQNEGRWEDAADVLVERARAVERAGADLLVLCTNTMQVVAPALEAGVDIPLLHIGDAAAAAVTAHGMHRVGLLGTAFTMQQSFYRDRLREHGIHTLTPGPAGQGIVHGIIYDELVRGIVREESRARFRAVIRDLVEQGAQGVILGCTEIELLVGAEDSPVPVFPTTRIHVEQAVARAFSD